ncbi:hypothetical protein REPUB_Repub04eG0075300 [Reevesia pubescens]
MTNFTAAQLMEIALGLEASRIEDRMKGKGLIIRGWAPQMLILIMKLLEDVTHCGWNSTLGVTAGVPMVTWPLSAEQFFNEKFETDVLKIGIVVGIQQLVKLLGDLVKRETIHVLPEGNRVADALACYGSKIISSSDVLSTDYFVIFVVPPLFVKDLIVEDILGMILYRTFY